MGTLNRQSVIVVSDVHLGHNRSNYRQFNDFLDWIGTAFGEKKVRKSVMNLDSRRRRIEIPDTIIFLGDLLELWEPKNDDMGNIGKQSRRLLEKITELPCEKIYILGNHDKGLEEFQAQTYAMSKGNLEIYYRHFPKNAEEYLTIGNSGYFFIHGHQFDKDMRWFRKFGESGPSLFLSLQRINRQLFRLRGFGSLGIVAVLYSLILCLASSRFEALVPYIVSFLLPFWGTNIIWAFLRPIARKIFKARHKDIKSIIRNGWYDPAKDTIAAENLVFAHTHYPGIEKVAKLGDLAKNKQLFINTENSDTILYNTESKEITYSDEIAEFNQRRARFSLI